MKLGTYASLRYRGFRPNLLPLNPVYGQSDMVACAVTDASSKVNLLRARASIERGVIQPASGALQSISRASHQENRPELVNLLFPLASGVSIRHLYSIRRDCVLRRRSARNCSWPCISGNLPMVNATARDQLVRAAYLPDRAILPICSG
jgi:hypothetical protein